MIHQNVLFIYWGTTGFHTWALIIHHVPQHSFKGVVNKFGISVHCYSVDTQLSMSFDVHSDGPNISMLTSYWYYYYKTTLQNTAEYCM